MGRTNFDVLMSCQTPEQFDRLYSQIFGCGCMQVIAQRTGQDKEVWKKHCLTEEYRGIDGCQKCKMEFWRQEYVGK